MVCWNLMLRILADIAWIFGKRHLESFRIDWYSLLSHIVLYIIHFYLIISGCLGCQIKNWYFKKICWNSSWFQDLQVLGQIIINGYSYINCSEFIVFYEGFEKIGQKNKYMIWWNKGQIGNKMDTKTVH